jgi:hypothetical protein
MGTIPKLDSDSTPSSIDAVRQAWLDAKAHGSRSTEIPSHLRGVRSAEKATGFRRRAMTMLACKTVPADDSWVCTTRHSRFVHVVQN